MNPKLFLFYLQFRKFLPAIALCSLAIVIINQYQNYQALCRAVSFRTIVREPWMVEEILSGDRFTARRDSETKTVTLCGIVSKDRDYLRSLIERGDGSVHLQKSHRSYEAWIVFSSPQESQIHLNTEMLVANKASLSNHHNCLSSENLELATRLD